MHRCAAAVTRNGRRAQQPCNLGAAYTEQKKDAEAIALYQRALEIDEKAFGLRHRRVAIALAGLADGYTRLGRFQDADESAYYEYICKRANIRVI